MSKPIGVGLSGELSRFQNFVEFIAKSEKGAFVSDYDNDPMTVRQMSDQSIKKNLDILVEAWEDRRQAQHELGRFLNETRPPDPPSALFESVDALIAFDREKWRYEDRLEDINTRIAEQAARFETRATAVKLLLPIGHSLRHTYQGNRPELEGRTYTLKHESTRQRGRQAKPDGTITVERLT